MQLHANEIDGRHARDKNNAQVDAKLIFRVELLPEARTLPTEIGAATQSVSLVFASQVDKSVRLPWNAPKHHVPSSPPRWFNPPPKRATADYLPTRRADEAAAMLLRRLRCPHELAALEAIDDGRLLLLPPQLAEGDTGWDWWSMSVKRLGCMVSLGLLL